MVRPFPGGDGRPCSLRRGGRRDGAGRVFLPRRGPLSHPARQSIYGGPGFPDRPARPSPPVKRPVPCNGPTPSTGRSSGPRRGCGRSRPDAVRLAGRKLLLRVPLAEPGARLHGPPGPAPLSGRHDGPGRPGGPRDPDRFGPAVPGGGRLDRGRRPSGGRSPRDRRPVLRGEHCPVHRRGPGTGGVPGPALLLLGPPVRSGPGRPPPRGGPHADPRGRPGPHGPVLGPPPR